MSIHEDTLQGLTEVLEYVKGDKLKGRHIIATIPDDEIDESLLFYQKFDMLPASHKKKAIQYVNELLQA